MENEAYVATKKAVTKTMNGEPPYGVHGNRSSRDERYAVHFADTPHHLTDSAFEDIISLWP